ncbi:MAG: GAF domain-containing protein [Bacteroidota bacterium]
MSDLPDPTDALHRAIGHAPMALFAFGADRRFTLLTGGALTPIGLTPADLLGEDITETYAHQPEIVMGVARVLLGAPVTWSVTIAGRQFLTVCAPVHDETGAVSGGVGASLDVTEAGIDSAEAEREAERRRRLLAATAQEGDFESVAEDVLRVMADLLDLDIGLLATTTRGTHTCLAGWSRDEGSMTAGQTIPLEDAYCDLTVELDDLVLIPHMAESEHRGHRCYGVFGLEAYVGAPVRVRGETRGVLSFSSARPARRAFTDADVVLLRLAAAWAGAYMEREEREAELRTARTEADRQAERLRTLASVFGQRGADLRTRIEAVLQTGRDLLGLEIAILSRVQDETYTVQACAVPKDTALQTGDTFAFSETYCHLALQTDDVLAIDYMEISPYRRHPAYSAFRLEAYIGTRIVVDGEVIGTLNFSSAEPRSGPFPESDRDLVRLMAEWIGATLEREGLPQTLTA